MAAATKRVNPREDAAEYLAKHKVTELFQELGTRLMFERPADPNTFLVETLAAIQKHSQAGKPTVFFSEQDVLTMFGMFDPTGRGYLTVDQYAAALESLDVKQTIALPAEVKMVDNATFARNIGAELKAKGLLSK